MIDYESTDAKTLLAQITEIETALTGRGTTNQVYVTAEISPHSYEFKPDIVFTPASGPRSDQPIFIEFYRKFGYPYGDAFSFIIDLKKFAEEYLQLSIYKYIIIDDSGIDELLKRRLSKANIIILEKINNSEHFVEKLIEHGVLPQMISTPDSGLTPNDFP